MNGPTMDEEDIQACLNEEDRVVGEDEEMREG